jgi:membrane protein
MKKLLDEFVEIRFAAASLAFSTLLSLIPFLIVVLAVFQSIGAMEQLYPQVEGVLFSFLKEATGNSVTSLIRNMIDKANAKPLGATGILLLIVTSLGLFRSIDIAFHRIWNLKLHKSVFKRMLLYSVIFTLILVALALYVGLHSVENLKVITEGIENNSMMSVWLTGFLLIIYKIIPDTKVSLIAAIIASGAAGLLLTIVQNSFFWIAVQIFRKNKIYGSLISFPIFLIWLFVVWCIVLAGVSLCAFLQKRLN